MNASLSRRALAGAVLLAPAAACATVLDIQASFDWAVQNHLAAIQARDMERLRESLTSGDGLILILPNGTLTTTKQAYLDFHTSWFASSTWRMTFEPEWTRQSTTLGQALYRTRYEDVENGAPIDTQNHVMLTFEREAIGWKLVADQNTRIPAG